MLISEKGLCKAVSDAAAHGGYHIRFNEEEGTLTLLASEWLINVETAKIPRKVLGLIVEHFGYIPESGCYSVKKLKEFVDVQTYMNEAFNLDVVKIAQGEAESAMYTGIAVWGKELYISESGKLRGANPVHFALLDHGLKPRITDCKSLMFTDEDSALFISVCDSGFLPETKQAMWDALEKIDWWKVKEAEPEQTAPPMDEGEQLAIEERGSNE